MTETNGPARPPGEPEPLLEENITAVLGRLDAWYAAHLPADEYRFNPPATQQQLDAFEQLVGIRMPEAYRQLYLWHDGDFDERCGHVYGLPLLSLSQAGQQWLLWNDVLADFGGNRYEISAAAWPQGAVDPAYINPRWIPLTYDSGGNHIGLDFDPWPGGRIGQVILYGRDEDVKAVLAQSLGGFLQLLAELLESGNFRLEPESEAPELCSFLLKAPPSDHFHDGIRELLGIPGPCIQ
jgi:cell wall assembly regulator SMI1